ENQLTRIRPGQPVTIDVDSFPDMELHGHVDSIQEGSGARFSAFPAENATGNFVKIVRRVPVKIVIEDGLGDRRSLPLGISVEPTVDTR
ncbi:MAG TPA: HlyD family secretion protein, partial [Alphaproteobacteria bacterium]|nr:HlyD family secretion protein [Alphaproteobacteria bacterium]